MIASAADGVRFGLGERRAAELGREQDERVVEHPALTEIAQQGGDRLIDAQRLLRVVLFDTLVAVPVDARRAERTSGKQLNKPHALFEQSSREQTTSTELGGLVAIQSVSLLSRGGLSSQIGHARDRQLHLRSQLITFDPRGEIALGPSRLMSPVDRCDELARLALLF